MPRHRTMRAVADWSYGLLSQDKQRFLRALGIFAGGFTGEPAAAVAMEAATADADEIDRLVDLVAKWLVVADVSSAKPRFRLLDTTRAYMLEKLDESGEREALARRPAEYYRPLFARAEAETPARTTGDWLADYAPEVDNLRAALDWAFSPGGEASTGVALTASAFPLWTRLSLPATPSHSATFSPWRHVRSPSGLAIRPPLLNTPPYWSIFRDGMPCRIGPRSAPGLNESSPSRLAVSAAILHGAPAARRRGSIPTSAFAH